MKNMRLPVAILSLLFLFPAIGLGQSKAKARQTPKVGKGGQICTGCCDPCYSDDGWQVKGNTSPANTQTNNSSARKRNTRRAK